MRQTELKPDKDGYYRRNLGFISMGNGRYVQAKISLGTVKRSAVERLDRIAAIWRRIEISAEQANERPAWDKLSLAVAKAIGKGQTEYRVEPLDEDPNFYIRFVDATSQTYPEVTIRPADEDLYRQGKAIDAEKLKVAEATEIKMLTAAAELKAGVLAFNGNDRKYVDLLGEKSLYQALDAYSNHIGTEYFDHSENSVNDTGKKKQDMVKQVKTYLDDRPLQSLTDFASVDHLYGVLRKRPVTHRYKKAMAYKSASNLIGELAQFFEWLHTSPKWEWREPVDYHKIVRKPMDLEADGDHETKDVPTYTMDQLKILFEYATPLERLLLLLGINCAYGADQIGRLRIGELMERKGTTYIRRIRRKKKVKGVHRLFAATLEGIKWATKGRESQKEAHVLINSRGRSLWRKTKGGNRSRDIPNAWYRLLDRIEVEHPKFPRHGFNTLRDTSANFIRRIAGEEVASVHLTHRHQSKDRNLRRYTNAPWKKVFRAQRILESKLIAKGVFDSESDPWLDREHQYVTQAQIKKMRELSKSGIAVTQIAREVGVATTTVYRWTERAPKASQAERTTQSKTHKPQAFGTGPDGTKVEKN